MIEPAATAMADERLTLLAGEAADFAVVSALMQDAIVRAGDIGWDRQGHRLAMLASRFRWEATETSRVRTALRIETVLKVARQRWPADPDTMLVLLSITADANQIVLGFADNINIRAEVECLDAVLEDLSAPWSARLRPDHDA